MAVIFMSACGGSAAAPDAAMIDAATIDAATIDAALDADCTVESACDENSPGPDPETCGECGAAGQTWGVPMYASRGICAYANGPGTGLHICGGESVTSDRQMPLTCVDGDTRTILQGSTLRSSHAFQCVEYARRYTGFAQPAYDVNAIGGNACQWWNAQVPGLQKFENGAASATSPPAEGDLLVFWNRVAGSLVCTDAKVGHIAVVSHYDRARGLITISEENYDTKPRQLQIPQPLGTAPWRITDTSTSLIVRGWLRLPSAAPGSCGVRSLLHTHAGLPHPSGETTYPQLVTCGPGSYCNVNAGQCRPIVPDGTTCASTPGACTGGTRCDGARCVCDDSVESGATYFRFDTSTRCWRPGPFVAGADGCSSTVGIAQDPSGVDGLLIRDMHTQDPMVISPRLSLSAAPDREFVVSATCEGLPGGATVGRMRLYLSRVLDVPEFDPAFGGFALPAQEYACDGIAHEMHFPMTVSAGTMIGRIRLDPLDGGSGGYESASVWLRSIEYRQVNSPACVDGDGDGYGVGAGCLGADCNDSEPRAWTGRTEAPGDNIDNNCNGLVDEYIVDSQGTFDTAMAISSGSGPVVRHVILQPGAYTVGSDVRLGMNVSYEGAGSGVVTINLQNHCFEVNYPGSSVRGVALVSGGGCFSGTVGGAIAVADGAGLTLQDVVITGAHAEWGGAISVYAGASLQATRVRLAGNMATVGSGGAVFVNGGSANFTSCVIAGNHAAGTGGGVSLFELTSSAVFRSVVVADNSAGDRGGGLYTEGAVQLDNVTLIDNSATQGGGFTAFSMATVTARSALLYSNTGGNAQVTSSASLRFSYSLVTPYDVSGSGAFVDLGSNLLDAVPQFIAHTDNGVYDDNVRLTGTSPGRNAGDPGLGNDADGSANDVGAYGGPGGGTVP